MTYSTAIICLVIFFICSLVWMAITGDDQKVISRKLLKLCVILFIVGTLIGMAGLLYREPVDFFNTVGLALAVMGLFSLYTWWYWHKRSLLDLDVKALVRYELPRAFAVFFIATAAVLHGLWATEVPRYKTAEGVMLLVAPVTVIILVPLFVVLTHRMWNRIPIVAQFYEHWLLPLDGQVPVIEPTTDAKRIFFKVPVEDDGEDTVDIDINAPNETRLKDIFHHILYRNRIERRGRKIIIAHQNKREFRYGWLLYRLQYRWYWWDKKIYLEMDGKVRFVDLVDGEVVYAERVRPWEFKR